MYYLLYHVPGLRITHPPYHGLRFAVHGHRGSAHTYRLPFHESTRDRVGGRILPMPILCLHVPFPRTPSPEPRCMRMPFPVFPHGASLSLVHVASRGGDRASRRVRVDGCASALCPLWSWMSPMRSYVSDIYERLYVHRYAFVFVYSHYAAPLLGCIHTLSQLDFEVQVRGGVRCNGEYGA
ncbi:hypothetical protein BC628DRAFT_966795 [Trametes gibbosa]|nr:hypothetical protein BC628DRAFT_966795 [Trametes gibbosa]